MPNVDPTVLLAHIDYAFWALNRTFECIDKLPPEAVTHAPGNSCRSILATLKHLFETDWYYFAYLKGGTPRTELHEGAVRVPDCEAPDEYEALKQEFLKLRTSIDEWARGNLDAQKDTVLHGWATWPAWQVIMHMSNHTTHHLGQISTLVRQAGYAPVQSEWTDLIIYYLQRLPAVSASAEALLKSDLESKAGSP